jgi:hypothetical protein
MKGCKIYAWISCFAFLVISGCKGVFNEPVRTNEDGRVVVGIAVQGISDAAARSILPSVSLSSITRYELWGNPGGGSILLVSFANPNGATAAVEKGTWDFTLKAFAGDTILLQGEVTDKLIQTSGHVLDFTLKPLAGVGAIHMAINFPSNAGVASAVVIKDGTEEILSLTGNSVVYDEPAIASGEYFISLKLKDTDGNVLAVYSELVLVGANLTSEKTVTLTVEDLKFSSLVPGEFRTIPLDTVAIQLTWDLLTGAASYRVYRSNTPDGIYSFIGDTTSLSFTDSDVYAAQSYYYRISAVNSNGAESSQTEASFCEVPLKIYAFSFASPAVSGTINDTSITATIPSVVNITGLVSSINHTGFSISPDPSLAQDFNDPVAYRITALNGSFKDYTVTVDVADTSLSGALSWLGLNAASSGEYMINLQDNETLAPKVLSYNGKTNINITIDGGDTEKTIALNQTGSLFTLASGVTLTLRGAVTLTGRNGNYSPLISVNSGGALNMNEGIKLAGNVNSGDGGAVSVSGTFNMNGGEICGNTGRYGGAVYVADAGSFRKTGGVIYGVDNDTALKNTATVNGHAVYAGTGKIRNYGADALVNMNSSLSGMAGGFEGAVVVNVTKNLNEWNLLTQTRIVESGTTTPVAVNGTYASYQWYLDGTTDGNSAVYSFNATGSRAEGTYELIVRVADNAGEERSGRLRITVNKPNPIFTPSIELLLNIPGEWDLLPQNQGIDKNSVTEFYVSGAYADYQWYLDGSLVGAGASYSFNSAGNQGGEVYELAARVTNSAGEQRTGRCRITVIKELAPEDRPQTALVAIRLNTPEEWDLLPQNQMIAKDTVTGFTVAGAYAGYQWYLDNIPVGAGGSYSFDSAGDQGGEVYELAVKVTDSAGEQRAGKCRITIIKELAPEDRPQAALIAIALNIPKEWDLLPQNQMIAKDTVTGFTVDGAYAGYEWYLDGVPVGAGESYSFDSAGENGGEVYELTVIVTGHNSEQRSGRRRITIQN